VLSASNRLLVAIDANYIPPLSGKKHWSSTISATNNKNIRSFND